MSELISHVAKGVQFIEQPTNQTFLRHTCEQNVEELHGQDSILIPGLTNELLHHQLFRPVVPFGQIEFMIDQLAIALLVVNGRPAKRMKVKSNL